MKITCCRKGIYERPNRFAKGCFTKEFDDIESFVKFFVEKRQILWFPNLRRELTKSEREVLLNKIVSVS